MFPILDDPDVEVTIAERFHLRWQLRRTSHENEKTKEECNNSQRDHFKLPDWRSTTILN